MSLAVCLLDGNRSARLLLDVLDDLSTRADHSTDHILWNIEGDDAWSVWLEVSTRFSDRLLDLTQDMQSTSLSLVQSLLQDLVRETVHLDIHLSSGDTILRTRHLEVHITEVILIAQDIGEHRVLHITLVGDQTHRDTGNRLLDLHTRIHQRQRTSADSSHGRRTVRLHDIGNDTHAIWIISRDHTFQGTPSEVTVTDFTTAHTTLRLRLARRERREVIVQQETLLAMNEHLIDQLLVLLRTQGTSRQGLRLTTGEDSRSVRAREVTHFAPDRTDVRRGTTIETLALVQDRTTHSLLLDSVVVTVDHAGLSLQILLAEVQ